MYFIKNSLFVWSIVATFWMTPLLSVVELTDSEKRALTFLAGAACGSLIDSAKFATSITKLLKSSHHPQKHRVFDVTRLAEGTRDPEFVAAAVAFVQQEIESIQKHTVPRTEVLIKIIKEGVPADSNQK